MPFDWTPHKGGKWTAEKVGDKVAGRIVHIENRDTKDGAVAVLTLRDRDGVSHDVWATGSDLRPKLADLEPQVGDGLRVTLTELKNVGQPQRMKVYNVELRRAGEDAE